MAIRALFEESLQRRILEPMVERASEEELDRTFGDLGARDLSPGYYSRAAYLIALANSIELGVKLGPSSFSASDIAGLQAVRFGRAEFEREHPACPACGERQENPWRVKCRACPYEFKRGKR